IAIASVMTPAGVIAAGRHGLGVLSLGAGVPGGPEALANQWKIGEETAAKHGKTMDRRNWKLVVNVHVAEDDAEAMRQVKAAERQRVGARQPQDDLQPQRGGDPPRVHRRRPRGPERLPAARVGLARHRGDHDHAVTTLNRRLSSWLALVAVTVVVSAVPAPVLAGASSDNLLELASRSGASVGLGFGVSPLHWEPLAPPESVAGSAAAERLLGEPRGKAVSFDLKLRWPTADLPIEPYLVLGPALLVEQPQDLS